MRENYRGGRWIDRWIEEGEMRAESHMKNVTKGQIGRGVAVMGEMMGEGRNTGAVGKWEEKKNERGEGKT